MPAFRLNLASVLFASAATAATSDASLTNTMTFRVDGENEIKSEASYITDGVYVDVAEEETVYLYVQGNDGTNDWVYSQKISEDGLVEPSSIMAGAKNANGATINLSTLDLSQCKIWLEKSDNNLAYAVIVHIHEWEYSASGDKITAVCDAADCPLNGAEKTIVIYASDKTYDGTAVEATVENNVDGTVYSSSIVYKDNTGTKVDGAANVGRYTANLTLTNEDSTEVTASVEFTIAPKTLEISSVTAINRAFDGTNTVEISEVIIEGILDEDNDNVSVSATAAIDSINAGEYIIVDLSNIALTGSANYSIAASVENVPLTTAVTISKADAPTLPSGSKAYVYSIGYEGESVSITGLPTDCGEVEYSLLSVSSDMFENVSVDSRSGKITYDVKELDNYTEDLQGIISVNVMMENYKTAIYTLTITRTEKIPQEISAENLSLTYGDTDATISVTGAKTELTYEVISDSNNNGDVVAVDENGKVSIKNAGTAIIKITAKESDTYEEAECEIRVTVDKRPVNIKAESYTVKKGDALPAFKYDVTGLVNADTLPITVSVACTASDTNAVGTYDITVSGVASEGNYTYTYTKGMLEVLAEDEAPHIVGDDGKMGWDVISDEINAANKGAAIIVDMNGATVVPGDIIEEARDKGITITFALDNGLKWTVDGTTVTTGEIRDINFGTTVEDANNPLNNIPVDIINRITGEKENIEVNLSYSGNFGFTAVLTVNLGSDNAGYYANLYYYNPASGKLEYICADMIDADGTTQLNFTHASDYIIIIDDVDLSKVSNDDDDDDTSEDTDDGKDNGKYQSANTKDTGNFHLWMIMLCAVLVMTGMAGYDRMAWKKEHRQ